MPVLNGLQLCDRLRRVPGYEKIPVIFVAAHDDPHARAASALLGAARVQVPFQVRSRAESNRARRHDHP